jgi:predicted GNAT family acetyltransferase
MQIEHDAARGRFHTLLDGLPGECVYRLDGAVMVLVHTEVDEGLQGRGVAGALVEAAVAHARAQGLKIRPACSYVRSWVHRHPEVQDLLA